MAEFSPPPLREPIAYVQVPGQRDRLPVMVDDRWWDYLCGYVFERIGGVMGLSTEEIIELIQQSQGAETLFQPATSPQIFPDVLQPMAAVQMTEMTLQC